MALIQVDEGGTDFGISTITEWVNGCQNRVALNRASQFRDSPLAPLTGTLFHALTGHYYLHGYFNVEKVTWKGADLTQHHFMAAEQKALRTFRGYRLQFEPTELGKVIAVEWPFKIERPEVIGCAPFTGRIDLIVKLTKRDCARLKKTRGIIVSPGYWIVDHKTASNIGPNTLEQHANSLQPTAYMLAWEHLTKKRVQGFLVNIITTTREPKFHTLVIQRPGKLERARLFYVTQAPQMAAWPAMDNPRCNNSRCFDYNAVCPHWVNANCNGFLA